MRFIAPLQRSGGWRLRPGTGKPCEAGSSVYDAITTYVARGKGTASADLTQARSVTQAKALGTERIVLDSSELARGVYRRTGVAERCEFRFCATGPIWTGEH
jgi:hypothetical protein